MEIGPPPYQADQEFDIQREWLKHFSDQPINIKKITIRNIIFSPEYNWCDGFKFVKGAEFTRKTFWKDAFNINLFEEVTSVEMPIYFCLGKKDYGVPFQLSEQYFDFITAPKKEIFWFDDSGHYPHLQEEDRFTEIMVSILTEVEKKRQKQKDSESWRRYLKPEI